MDELISRQVAIDALKGLPTWWADEGGYYGGAQPPMVALLDPEDAVSAIENLPSAQPEPHYDEWCNDCKEYDKERHCCPRWNKVIRETLKDAQPEIIRCKDCKYSSPNGKYGCKSYHYKLYETHEMKPDDFCSFAERRTDE